MFSALWGFIAYSVTEWPNQAAFWLTGDRWHFLGAIVMILVVLAWLATVIFSAIALFAIIDQLWRKYGPYEYYFTDKSTCPGKVVDLDYESAKSSTSVSPVIGGNGGVAVNSSYSPAEYNVVISTKKIGKVILDDERLFDQVEVGDKVEVEYYHEMRKRKDGRGSATEVDTWIESVELPNGRKIVV